MGNVWQPFFRVCGESKGGGHRALVGAGACSPPPQTDSHQEFASCHLWHRRESGNSCSFMGQRWLPRRTSNLVHLIINLAHHTSPASLVQDSALCREVTRWQGWRQKALPFFIPYTSVGTYYVPCTVLGADRMVKST